MDQESETLVKKETVVEESTVVQREEADLRQIFNKERRTQESIRQQKIQERLREGIEAERFSRIFEEQQGRYVIYKVIDKASGEDHRQEDFTEDEEGVRVVREGLRFNEQIQFERFSGYSFYKVPQKICHLQEEENTRGPIRFRRRKGGSYQFEGILAIAAAVSWFQSSAIADQVEKEQDKVSFQEIHQEADNEERYRRQFGRKVVFEGIETSELYRLIYYFSQWRRVCIELREFSIQGLKVKLKERK